MQLLDLNDTDALIESARDSALFVNATRVGMGDLENVAVIDASLIPPEVAVADTVYNPRKTKLLREAEASGHTIVPGLSMLLRQATVGEELWVNADMPVDLIKDKFFTS